jgi:hypothetical protein
MKNQGSPCHVCNGKRTVQTMAGAAKCPHCRQGIGLFYELSCACDHCKQLASPAPVRGALARLWNWLTTYKGVL